MYCLCTGVGYGSDILPEGINDTDCIIRIQTYVFKIIRYGE